MIAAVPPPTTLSPAAAAAVPWEAVVIGAGPAGSATAIRLARAGWRVLLVERFAMPRPKVCGCCLSTRAHAELRSLFPTAADQSILGEIPLDHVRVMATGRTVRLPLPAGGVLSREAFDTALVREAINAGAAWLPYGDVTTIVESPAAAEPLRITCRVSHDHDTQCTLAAAKVVIAAGLVDHIRVSGGRSTKRVQPGSRVGLGGVLPARALDLPAGELVMAVGGSGYCGIVRLEDGRIDLAAAVDRQALAVATPAEAVIRILREAAAAGSGCDIADAIPATTDLLATPPLTHTAPLVGGATRRIFRVGDAAGYVEPFTGEGMGWALSSSRILAAALLGGGPPADVYERGHAGCFRRLHRRCQRIAAALRHPRLVGSAIRAAAAAPWAARHLVPLVVGASSASGDIQ